MRDDELFWSYEAQYEWEQWHASFQCPHGHGQMDYFEGTIEQDEQGNNIDACNHYCPKCGYATEMEEL